jgi:glycosyltransferase involved in cell wall biosynthesis
MTLEPLVSVLTPAYNRAEFLSECIESVQAQTYSNWEYIIVNNCSTDDTLDVARRYAATDSRIRVYSNDALLDLNSNHNLAFSLISPASRYCKIVSADDWLFPECLERMVSVAETNHSVGIVGSYQLSGGGSEWGDWSVRWAQVPYPSGVVPGRDICRLYMQGGIEVFGSPTSLLYRADLVRKHKRFFPNSGIHADTSACCNTLQESDYAFVHQVLSYERVHDVRVTTECQSLNSYLSCQIADVMDYGRSFLSPAERDQLLARLMRQYYDFLAISALKFRERQFWTYHRARFGEIGLLFSRTRLGRSIASNLLRLLLDPRRVLALARKHLLALRRAPNWARLSYALQAAMPSALAAEVAFQLA